MTPWRRAALAAVVAVVVAGAGACGIPDEAAPRTLEEGAVPFGLLDTAPSTPGGSTADAPSTVGAARVVVYLLDADGLLVPRVRPAEANTEVGALRTLLAGLRPDESDAGLRSAVPEATELLGFRKGPENGSTIVDLSDEFLAVQGEQQIKAVAQVVLTLTEIRGVTGVRFAFEGQVRPVFQATGVLTDMPLKRESFTQLTASAARSTTSGAPAPATTTATSSP